MKNSVHCIFDSSKGHFSIAVDSGKPISLEKLYSQVSKHQGRAKILAHADIKLPGATSENDSARIVFLRDRNRSKQWLALVSTDLSLLDEEVVQMYEKC